jgi:hypothetical protein
MLLANPTIACLQLKRLSALLRARQTVVRVRLLDHAALCRPGDCITRAVAPFAVDLPGLGGRPALPECGTVSLTPQS